MFQPNDRVMVDAFGNLMPGTVVGFGSMKAPRNCITHLRVGEGEWQQVVLVQIDRFQAHGPTACHADNLRVISTHIVDDPYMDGTASAEYEALTHVMYAQDFR